MAWRGIRGAVLALAWFGASAASGQEVIDRIVARVENDVILQSDVRELARYQILAEGKAEGEEQILDRLIDQWIVRSEADASRFAQPSEADVEHAMNRLEQSFGSAKEFEQKRKQAGLSTEEVRKVTRAQVYLNNYLDSRFRPAVRVEPQQIEEFYKTAVLPRAQARGREAPTLEAARDFIQEALVQRGIDEQADRWLKESRLRLHVEKLAAAAK